LRVIGSREGALDDSEAIQREASEMADALPRRIRLRPKAGFGGQERSSR
jgi:hypothetical protein